MIPVILLVVAGVFIGLGLAFANMEKVYDLGFMVMRYLPIFFVTGITFGLYKNEKGGGALGGIVLFIGMYTVINTVLFVAPLLYFVAYVPLAGLTYVLT